MTDVRRRESNGRIAVTVAPTTAPAPRGSARSWPALVHVALLAAVYAGVIAAGSADAWSGSDAGGKVATVRSMADDGSWHPDVGYWAETADPAGQFHPLIKTARHGDDWVQVTSLPLVYAAVPLWRLGGSTAILLLPALGALAAAWSARAVARNLGATTGWSAFWLVGAGSPVLFYAGDFWEHAPALGLFVGAVALLTRLRSAGATCSSPAPWPAPPRCCGPSSASTWRRSRSAPSRSPSCAASGSGERNSPGLRPRLRPPS